ncbi:protein sel-1 homolog 1-like isoform X1 [Dreissena polymorpha]|uniref:protein sel-1 homolog 1-like isoform X1 n=1 Tax=Dreissena polymorpha TaxID=45954 RepID=UPI0022656208|nr:protein sel-1 homolog 1-like isoform X1 [Dreissena polymorpha]
MTRTSALLCLLIALATCVHQQTPVGDTSPPASDQAGKDPPSAATKSQEMFQSEAVSTSENVPTGTAFETKKLDQELKVQIKQKSTENTKVSSTETLTVNREPVAPDVPGSTVEQTQSPSEGTTSGTQPHSTPEGESPEEKHRREEAQQYFEEGEKLINNSYKKDYVQAYQYFQVAANRGHKKALEYLGFGHLLGDYVSHDPKRALQIFEELSNKGSPRGQLGLGFSYAAGLATNSSQAKALIYFTFSALGGDPLALMVMGYRSLSGIGVEAKCETALTYYRKVATTVAEKTSSGSPVVQRIRLHEQAETKDTTGNTLMDDDLLQYYEFLADKGDVQAQVVLGQLYYQGGKGVPINHERAQHYFLMAAESGNSNAMAFLGKMHSEGSPVIAQDPNVALEYFKKAANKGNTIGQCGMGIIYMYGRGVEKDYPKALRFFSQSADQGWSDAQLHLGIMHFSGKGVRRDYKMAVKYFNLASQGGHVLAFYHLAQMHATGTGVLRNCHTAVELYKNVAERGEWSAMLMDAHDLYKQGSVNEALLKYTFLAELGYEVAQTNVAYILDQGESSLFDAVETYQRALLHWTRAASQGSTIARLKMGDYHYYGYGTEIDYETAASHYRLATEQQHNAQAMFNLGYMHEQGLGLKQDIHLAKRFYDQAAETSGDAYIPVTLALLKMAMFYGTEVFNKEMEDYYASFQKLDIRLLLGPNWDVYVATFLAIVLGLVLVIVRQTR